MLRRKGFRRRGGRVQRALLLTSSGPLDMLAELPGGSPSVHPAFSCLLIRNPSISKCVEVGLAVRSFR